MKVSYLFGLLMVSVIYGTANAQSNKALDNAYQNAGTNPDYSTTIDLSRKNITLKAFNKWANENMGTSDLIDLLKDNTISGTSQLLAMGMNDQITSETDPIAKGTLKTETKKVWMYGAERELVTQIAFVKESNLLQFVAYWKKKEEEAAIARAADRAKAAIILGLSRAFIYEGIKEKEGIKRFGDDISSSSLSGATPSSTTESSSSNASSSSSSLETKKVEIIISRKDRKCCLYLDNSICFDIYIDGKKQNFDEYTISQDKNGDWVTDCAGALIGGNKVCSSTSYESALTNYYYYRFGKNENVDISIK